MFRIVKIRIAFVTLITTYTNLATLKLDTHSSVQTLIDFTRTLLAFLFLIASMRSMVFECLDNFLCFSLSSRTSHYENTQCYFSVGLPRTVCAFVRLILDNILQQCFPGNTVKIGVRAIFGQGGGGVNHLPKKFMQVAQIFTK